MWVGGYYVSFESTRTFMNRLHIHDRGLPQERYEYLINNRFAGQEKFDIFTGFIPHPRLGSPLSEDGKLFRTYCMLALRELSRNFRNVKQTWRQNSGCLLLAVSNLTSWNGSL